MGREARLILVAKQPARVSDGEKASKPAFGFRTGIFKLEKRQLKTSPNGLLKAKSGVAIDAGSFNAVTVRSSEETAAETARELKISQRPNSKKTSRRGRAEAKRCDSSSP